MAGNLALAGIHTGIDTDALVSATMELKRQRLYRMQRKSAVYSARRTAYTEIEQWVTKFRDRVAQTRSASHLRGAAGTTSNSGVLTVSAADGAIESSYGVLVNQIATAERKTHEGVASMDTLVGAGQFVYTYNGTTRTLYTTDTTTLEGLVTLINNDASNPGIHASVLQYEVDPDHKFHLALSGKNSGSDYTIAVEAGTDLAAFAADSFQITQTAQNSQVRVDGYPAGAWIERSGNTISDAVPNVTLELVSTGEATISVRRTRLTIEEDIEDMVAIYNGMMERIESQTGFNKETGRGGLLQGDITVTSVTGQIRPHLTGSVAGFLGSTDSFTMLSDLGVEVDRFGKLTLDLSKLRAALDKDYDGVVELLTADRLGSTGSSYFQYNSALAATRAGSYEVEADFDALGTLTGARIRGKGETEWRTAAISGSVITGAAGSAEQGLALTAVWDGSSATQSSTVQVREGAAAAMYDTVYDILSPLSGVFVNARNGIDSAVRELNDYITQEQDRLAKQEQRLRARFARMEGALAQLDSMNAAVSSMVQSLSANSKSQ